MDQNEIQARLRRMVEEDPYGKEAERLLHCLATWGIVVHVSAIPLLAPKDMPPDIQDLAFKALQTWQFVEFKPPWKIHAGIFPLLSPPDLFQRMLNEDPYGKEAQTLLNYLAVMGPEFEITDIPLLAPPDMPEEIRTEAFETLKRWVFVRLSGNYGRSWRIRDEILASLRPPDPDRIQRRQFDDYVSMYANSALDDISLHRQLTDMRHDEKIRLAVLWGLDHDPEASFNLIWRLYRPLMYRSTMVMIGPVTGWEWMFLFRKAYKKAKELNSRLAWARLARILGDKTQSKEHYKEAFDLYILDDNIQEQIDVLMGLRMTSIVQGDIGAAQAYCEDILAIAQRINDIRIQMETLRFIAWETTIQGDLNSARSYLQRLLQLQDSNTGPWGNIATLQDLAALSVRLNAVSDARHYFARLGYNKKTLWDWGQFEYSIGNTSEGCSLCRLAILELSKELDSRNRDSFDEVWLEIVKLRQDVTAMGCDDV